MLQILTRGLAVTFVLLSAPLCAAEPERADLATLQATAAQGNAWSQVELAARYEEGDGLPKDFSAANKLYCRAARQGDAEAQYRLGLVYARGRGVNKDEGAAARLLAMAAEQNHPKAVKLSEFLHGALGVLPNCMLPDPPVLGFAPYKGVPQSHQRGGNAEERTRIVEIVRLLAPKYAIDPQLALAVISVESAFNPAAVSPKNAQGAMQLIPETAHRFGVRQPLDAADNIKGGLAYLRFLLAMFQGRVPLVVAAYNAGEKAVEKYSGVPPYAETQQYVRKISLLYRKATHPYEAAVVAPSPMMARWRG